MNQTNPLPSIRPADRLGLVGEYYFSRKLKEIARRRAAGEDIISLAIGSPDMPPSPSVRLELVNHTLRDHTHGYQPTVGIPELRQAMADWYKRWYDVDLDYETEIQPLIGSKEGILHVTLAFCNPGDTVLVPNPGYPTYTSLSRLLGQKVVYYDLRPENDWQPDFDALDAMDLTDVKLMWTNYPHMPTGARPGRKTYERLVDFARRKGIVIVNDNPYSLILNRTPKSILQVPGAKECCIEMNSMSKSHNMPGWRVGLLATNAEFIRWILKVKSNIDNGMSYPIQMAAAMGYKNPHAWHTTNNITVYKKRRVVAEEIMQSLGCTFDPRQVGMFLWGRIPDCYASAEELTERVLNEAHVFITPGFIFGSAGERYVRISLCATKEKLAEALDRIKELNIRK